MIINRDFEVTVKRRFSREGDMERLLRLEVTSVGGQNIYIPPAFYY
jgi:hypothetical protein